ncbi:hypothetical protein XENOCAPTIV_001071 [Xenoophorus captivus]|uniref:Uncharacterized protein n=1 Tax=Xenoophorus captivus TaxID=1517983 RepID=A0ABV0S5R9_9TELE
MFGEVKVRLSNWRTVYCQAWLRRHHAQGVSGIVQSLRKNEDAELPSNSSTLISNQQTNSLNFGSNREMIPDTHQSWLLYGQSIKLLKFNSIQIQFKNTLLIPKGNSMLL